MIRFWVGLLQVGRPSSHTHDCSLTLCLGNLGEVPPPELPWKRIWRWRWNWLPDRFYKKLGSCTLPATDAELLHSALTGDPVPVDKDLLPIEFTGALDSSRWTGREFKLVGFGTWRWDYWSFRSSRSAKMYVYVTGDKTRKCANHTLYVAPGQVTPKDDCPSDWFNMDGTPKQFAIKFVFGRASVDNQLGEWLIKVGECQRTKLIRGAAGMLLGNLASTLSGR